MAKELSLVAYNDLESQVEALERDGYVYFPSVLDADEIAELRATMDRLEAIPECLDTHQSPQNGGKFLNKIINNSFNRDPLYLPADIRSDPRVKIPIFITTAHYYLNDMYEELGPTKFVPGSHFSGCSPNGATEWNNRGEESILCNAGDVVLFRSEVWHRGSANTSDEVRYLMQVHYAQRMITQKYPPYLNKFQFEASILAQATSRQRRLMGDHRPSNYD
jgi:ectoine hydroxylase-related dioxygenase (phytanoyl-CoA dioxygenase family)